MIKSKNEQNEDFGERDLKNSRKLESYFEQADNIFGNNEQSDIKTNIRQIVEKICNALEIDLDSQYILNEHEFFEAVRFYVLEGCRINSKMSKRARIISELQTDVTPLNSIDKNIFSMKAPIQLYVVFKEAELVYAQVLDAMLESSVESILLKFFFKTNISVEEVSNYELKILNQPIFLLNEHILIQSPYIRKCCLEMKGCRMEIIKLSEDQKRLNERKVHLKILFSSIHNSSENNSARAKLIRAKSQRVSSLNK